MQSIFLYNIGMVSEPATLARNTSYFTLALVAQKVISFLYFTFLARLLGPATMGKYVLALSFTTIFSVLLDLGLGSVLTREVARDNSKAGSLVELVFGFKVLAGALVAIITILIAKAAGYPPLTLELIAMASVMMVIDSFILSAYSTIRGFQVLIWESIGTVLMQVVVATLGFAVSRFTHDVRVFMAALLCAVIVNAVYALWQLAVRFKVSLRPVFHWTGWHSLARLTWPFAVAATLTRVYGYIDQVMLSLLSGDVAVGVYSVAYKITFAFQFIPVAFSASLYPGLSAYFVQDKTKLASAFSRALVYLMAIGVPVSWGIAVLAPQIVRSLYPGYHGATLPLQILILSLPFLFATWPVGALLPACNRQTRYTANIAVVTVFNILLNILLIPEFSTVGAATSSFVSTLLLLILGWVVVRQLVVLDYAWLLSKCIRIVGSGVAMVAVAWVLVHYVPWYVVVVVAGAVYSTLTVVTGAVSREELISLWRQVLKKENTSVV